MVFGAPLGYYSMIPKLTPPLVSVVVPTFNYAHLLPQTLESLEKQTYENWECVVVDDGSTDNTADVVANYASKDSRIRYVKQENSKQAAARNTGIQNSTGEYFQFLDSDDLIEPAKLECQVKYLESHPEIDIVYSNARYFRSENMNERLHSRRYSMWDDGEPWMTGLSGDGASVLRPLLCNNIMVVNSPLIRRSVVETVGLFNVDLTPVEDWDYWIRCAAKGFNFEYDDQEQSRALVRAHALSASLDGRRMLRATVAMRKSFFALTLTAELQDLNRRLLAEAEGLLGIEEVINGRRWLGIYQICKAACLDRRPRYRAKWLLCAASAPFVSNERLLSMVGSSLTGGATEVLRKLGLKKLRAK